MVAREMEKADPKSDPRFLSSVERGFLVLDALSEGTGPMSLTEIARVTGLAIPTLQRLTATLVQTGYVEKENTSKRYRPTVKTVDLLHSYLSRNQFAKRAWPHLVKLREELGLDVSLSVPAGDAMLYVHRLPGYAGNFENTLPGRKIPIHLSASGRCVLSMMDPDAAAQLLGTKELAALTPWSLASPDVILSEVEKARELGYAIVRQEASAGTLTLACPITKSSKAIAGISVHAPIAGLDETGFLDRVLQPLVLVCRALSMS